jgi:hypothetical protein
MPSFATRLMRAYTNLPLTPEVETGAKSGAPRFQARVSLRKTQGTIVTQVIDVPETGALAAVPGTREQR